MRRFAGIAAAVLIAVCSLFFGCSTQQSENSQSSSIPNFSETNEQDRLSASPSEPDSQNTEDLQPNSTAESASSESSSDAFPRLDTGSAPSSEMSKTSAQDESSSISDAADESIAVADRQTLTCTFSIRCDTIFDNLDAFNPDKLSVLPENGILLPPTEVTFEEGESVFDVLLRTAKVHGIPMESTKTPAYRSYYIEGIGNLYEFDCGNLSGWIYLVNGEAQSYGCSQYFLQDGDIVEWVYTCDLGYDVQSAMEGE